ncbi:MAG: mechanosensitive ion channel [Pseudomonadales bacterium]|nr:mechanosensitive ion channel [Pseudomonadales bacterium]MBO6597566.1 mechanosensitive ion channel [Pseudomonadales bacterium]MBO6657051.1 mechanosensitive ion channel [Pseudomonadales bacterium]MBO6704231.1 mechanosensitive ion channel [Pseudomonadales bacterium]MBO6824384.1 mechanosensitive ion channel [Pseudomonadales bacterium]
MDTSLLIQYALGMTPALLTLVIVMVLLALMNFLLRRNKPGEIPVFRQVLLILSTAAGVLLVIFMLPISETSRGQILSLLGIVITAVIALSSTTFVANIMAGLMLRAVNSFHPGDFIRSQDMFGRVTERGLFHTEIQTEDRDLATVPNLFLVTNPVTVVHDSGTIISATLSLGYDISHRRIEELLIQAANDAGLTDSFVLVGELGDFSVSYRVGGFFEDVSKLLTAKSNLRKKILSVLHRNGVEIVSPNFMNQRVLAEDKQMIPRDYREDWERLEESTAEEVIFDKADSAAEKESLKKEKKTAKARLIEIDAELKANNKIDTASLEHEKIEAEKRLQEIEASLNEPNDETKDG